MSDPHPKIPLPGSLLGIAAAGAGGHLPRPRPAPAEVAAMNESEAPGASAPEEPAMRPGEVAVYTRSDGTRVGFQSPALAVEAIVATWNAYKAKASGSEDWAQLWEARFRGHAREDQVHRVLRALLLAPRGRRPRPEARVLAALFQNPGATDEQIAAAAEVNRTSLYRMRRFRAARAAQRAGRGDLPSANADV